MLKTGDRVTRAGNPLLHIDEFSGVIIRFWRVNGSRMVQVCDGQNCILTGENDICLTPHQSGAAISNHGDGPEQLAAQVIFNG